MTPPPATRTPAGRGPAGAGTARPARGRRAARLAAVTALAALLLAPSASAVAGPGTAGPSPVGTASAPSETSTASTDPVSVQLVEMKKPVARGGDTVTLTVLITNNTSEPVVGARAKLLIDYRAVTDVTALEEWTDAPLDAPCRGTSTNGEQQVEPLGPGESTTMDFQYDFRLGSMEGWGPRRLAVLVSDDGGRLGCLRSFVVYDAQDGTAPDAPVDLSIALPVTGPVADPGDPTAQEVELARQTAEGGRLDRLLDVASTGSVALAVDPSTVALAATATGSDDEPMHEWADAIEAVGATTSVFALPAYDPDLGALAHSGIGPEGLTSFLAAPLPAGWSVPSTWASNLAWPADGVPTDLRTVNAGVVAGRNLVVVGGGALAPADSDRSVSGLASVTVDGGAVATALVSDQGLSAALASGTEVAVGPSGGDLGVVPPSAPATTVPTAEAVQEFLARAATIAAHDDGEPHHAFVTLPRHWMPDLDAYDSALAALQESGFVRIAPVTELLAGPVPAVERQPLSADGPRDGELPPDVVGSLDRARSQVVAFSSVAGDNAPAVMADAMPRLVAPLAVGYRLGTGTRDAAVAAAVTHAEDTLGLVRVVPRVGINFLTSEGNLPVRVRNDLPVDAVVAVVLRPDDLRLQVQSRPQVVIPAGTEKDVLVPVRALGAGVVDVNVEVLAPTGQRIGLSDFEVRVNAQWEAAGTWVGGVLVALLFAAGVWRTVRRGRSPYRATVADVEAATGEVAAAAAAAAASPDPERPTPAPEHPSPAHARQQ